jgi:hypothetical protein
LRKELLIKTEELTILKKEVIAAWGTASPLAAVYEREWP